MRANLEGQREVVAQVAHMLHSPVAALDYQVRLLNADESFVALFQENSCIIGECMNLIMKISSQFTQHPELCATTSTDSLQQHRLPENTHVECPATGEPPDATVVPLEPKVASERGLLWRSRGSLPVRKGSKKVPAPEPRPMHHDGNLVIMLVDDVQCLREAQMLHLKSVSSQWDVEFIFREASTGEECLSQCISQVADRQCVPPHVIVMDQYMHDAGGKLLGSATVRQLRQNGFQGLVIGCSGNVECEQLFDDAGADYFWGKPGPPDSEISELLEHYFGLIKVANESKLHENKDDDSSVKHMIQTNVIHDSTDSKLTAAAVEIPNLIPSVEFCDALRLIYGPGVEEILSDLIHDIQKCLAELKSKRAARDAHTLKGLFGALYLKDAFDECELIYQLSQSQFDGNQEKIELHIQNVLCLFNKSMAGEILPEKEGFFARGRP